MLAHANFPFNHAQQSGFARRDAPGRDAPGRAAPGRAGRTERRSRAKATDRPPKARGKRSALPPGRLTERRSEMRRLRAYSPEVGALTWSAPARSTAPV